ncbi:MAG TPA: FixH family protein [Aliarcobacter cryaerophilus]|nr:FixH family protein [Aliarcobacter cryaerophilus]
MKNIIKIVLGFFLTFTFLNAELLEQNGQKDGINVSLKSSKALVVGSNELLVELSKDSKVIENAKVKAKFFMPEMPGMPYMESESEATLVDKVYKLNINLPMGGTWQYQLKFKTEDGVVHTIKGSVNL